MLPHFASGLVLLSPRQLHEALVAKLTFEGSLTGVNSLMSLHIGLLDKGLATEAALVLLHFHVDFFVPL